MGISKALELDAGKGRRVAIATYEIVEVLTEGKTTPVPLAPSHCRDLLEWKGKLLPVFDLAAWPDANARDSDSIYWAIVLWQVAPDMPIAHACLRVAGFPEMVDVDDSQACMFPEDGWRAIAGSCYQDEAGVVPILQLEKIFQTGDYV